MPHLKFLPQSEFHRVARAGNASTNVGIVRPSATILRTSGASDDVRRWRFSDYGVDRMKDRINPLGWDVRNFLAAGGPVLFAHDSLAPPIGRTLNPMTQTAVALDGDIKFAVAEYELAATLLRLVDGGYLKGGSVGFLPRKWKWSDDPDRPGGVDFLETELLEFSLTPIPALPSSLIQARALGVDTRPLARWAERALDSGGNLTVSRGDLLRLRAEAQEPPRARSGSRAPHRRSADSGGGVAPAGNCGRPSSRACGLLDPAECSIHGQGGSGMGTDDDQRALRRLRASAVALRRDVIGAVALRAAGHRRLSALQRRAAELRKGSELPDDPRIIAAEAAFHFRSW